MLSKDKDLTGSQASLKTIKEETPRLELIEE